MFRYLLLNSHVHTHAYIYSRSVQSDPLSTYNNKQSSDLHWSCLSFIYHFPSASLVARSVSCLGEAWTWTEESNISREKKKKKKSKSADTSPRTDTIRVLDFGSSKESQVKCLKIQCVRTGNGKGWNCSGKCPLSHFVCVWKEAPCHSCWDILCNTTRQVPNSAEEMELVPNLESGDKSGW